MQTPAGILLVGGRSRRMGRDKALLPFPGTRQGTFVEHLATVMAAQCSELVLVARDAAQAAQLVLSPELAERVRIVTDALPAGGPLMGLYSGLRATTASRALLAAVDMPFVSPAMIAFLLTQSSDEAVFLPVVEHAPQVLLAVYPRVVLPVIESLLQAGERGPRALLERVPVRYVFEAQLRTIDPLLRSFVNINTPEELAAQETSWREGPAG